VKKNTRSITTSICALLLLIAEAGAQTPTATATPYQLTAEQKAALTEALTINRRVLELNAVRKFDEAVPLAEQVIKLRRAALGEGDAQVAEAISNLAALYVGKQDYDRAETDYRRALTIYENLGGLQPNMGYVLDSLALLRWSRSDYSKAEAYAKSAIDLKEKLHGASSAELIESLNVLIKIYDSAGKSSQRNTLLVRLIGMLETSKRNPQ